MPDARVTAVVDIDRGRRLEAVATWPSAQSFASLEHALAEADIDAVLIATPAATHVDLIERALRARKHVMCEKPLCLSSSDAVRLVELARRLGLLLLVDHTFLREPGLLRVKQLVERGALGPLRYITAIRSNVSPIRCDIGVIHDLLTHDVAILNWLMDSVPTMVRATGASLVQTGIEDVAFVTLQYAEGPMLAHISASWLEPVKQRRITCTGSVGTALWDTCADPPLRLFHETIEQGPGSASRERTIQMKEVTFCGDVEPLWQVHAEFLGLVCGGGTSELASPAFNAGVVQTVEAIFRSFKQSGECVPVPSVSAVDLAAREDGTAAMGLAAPEVVHYPGERLRQQVNQIPN